MIELLLRENVILGLLAAAAVLMPLIGLSCYRLHWAPRRPALLIGALGPFALIYWFFHNLILSLFGFDSVLSAAIVILVAAAIGLVGGNWAARGN